MPLGIYVLWQLKTTEVNSSKCREVKRAVILNPFMHSDEKWPNICYQTKMF